MSTLRGLLKLEDKVAAESRRLEQLGGPSLGHLLPLIVVAVLALHVVVLLLPAVPLRASLPAASTPQDFPLVWRPGGRVQEDRAAPEATGSAAAPSPPEAAAPTAAPVLPWIEPVPEPAPVLAGAPISAEVEALIPPPDALPPTVEPEGIAPAAPAPPRRGGSPPVQRVRPVYPVAARALRVDARVTLQVLVAPDGSVTDASVLGSSRTGLGFEAAAVDAVRQWRYEPRDPAKGPRAIVVTIDFKGQEAMR